MNAAPQFTLGPLCYAIEPGTLEAFIAQAPPGERITYATGFVSPRSSETWAVARRAVDQGKLRTHQVRRDDGKGFDYIAVRREAPVVADAAAAQDAAADDAMLRQVRRCINLRIPFPTNAQLARLCELQSDYAARYRLKRLIDAGLIRLIDNGPMHHRVVVLVETGQRTPEARL